MFYKILILGAVFVFLFFSSDHQKTSVTDQVTTFIEQLFQSSYLTENAALPVPTNVIESETPPPTPGEPVITEEMEELIYYLLGSNKTMYSADELNKLKQSVIQVLGSLSQEESVRLNKIFTRAADFDLSADITNRLILNYLNIDDESFKIILENKLIELSKQLNSHEIDLINRMIQFPEYDDLELVLETIQYRYIYKNLEALTQIALDYDIKTYTSLAEITEDVLPEPLPAPTPMAREDKELIISQFLNSEGDFTNVKLLTKIIPQYEATEAYLGIASITDGFSYSSNDPIFEINRADFEAVLLFTETVGRRNYCVIGVTDINGNRMVTLIEIFDYNFYDDVPYHNNIVFLHCKDLHAGSREYYFMEFDNHEDYLLFLNKYRNNVLIAEIRYTEVDFEKYFAYDEKYSPAPFNEMTKASITHSMNIYNSKANVGAGLLKSIWKTAKRDYEKTKGGAHWSDLSAGIKKIMSISAPETNKILKYDDVLALLQSPDLIPIADISFRNDVLPQD